MCPSSCSSFSFSEIGLEIFYLINWNNEIYNEKEDFYVHEFIFFTYGFRILDM